jgi:hypothetical protein
VTYNTCVPFTFPAVVGKKVTAAFDGGGITSDGGAMVFAQAKRRLAIGEKLTAVIADPRDPLQLMHQLPEILRTRILAIACGYEDANDLDRLRFAGFDRRPAKNGQFHCKFRGLRPAPDCM